MSKSLGNVIDPRTVITGGKVRLAVLDVVWCAEAERLPSLIVEAPTVPFLNNGLSSTMTQSTFLHSNRTRRRTLPMVPTCCACGLRLWTTPPTSSLAAASSARWVLVAAGSTSSLCSPSCAMGGAARNAKPLPANCFCCRPQLQVADVYRKVRFTLRYLLGNLADFDPQGEG